MAKAQSVQALATAGRLKDAPMGSPISTKRTEQTQSPEHLLVLKSFPGVIFTQQDQETPPRERQGASPPPARPGRPQTTEATQGTATDPPTAPKSQLPGPRTRRPVLEPRRSEGAFFATPTPTDTRGRASPAAGGPRRARTRQCTGAGPGPGGPGAGGYPPSLGRRRGEERAPPPSRSGAPPGLRAPRRSRLAGRQARSKRERGHLLKRLHSFTPCPSLSGGDTSRPLGSRLRAHDPSAAALPHRPPLTPPLGGAAPQGPRSAQYAAVLVRSDVCAEQSLSPPSRGWGSGGAQRFLLGLDQPGAAYCACP
nr:PREDICTED: basic salivary proline-rich protein 3-like [Equus przewalskii]